jgi:sugar lactone lactonase YvrE
MSDIRTRIEGVRFGEGARWRDGCLWYSEMFASRVMRFDPRRGASEVVCEIADGTPSGLGFLPDGRLLVVHMQRCAILRLDAPGNLVVHADLSREAICLLNDMAVAPNGNAYAGSTGRNFFTGDTEKRPANVILVRPDGSAEVVADDVAGPNGPAITPDGRCLLLAESNLDRLLAFDIGADGRLSNRRVWADLHPVHPDGIALDAEGAVWVASPQTNEVVRVVEGGVITQRIARPTPVICCALGGRTLYLFRISEGSALDSSASGLFESVEVEVAGAGSGVE